MLRFRSAFRGSGCTEHYNGCGYVLPLAVLFPLDMFLKMRLHWVKELDISLTFYIYHCHLFGSRRGEAGTVIWALGALLSLLALPRP